MKLSVIVPCCGVPDAKESLEIHPWFPQCLRSVEVAAQQSTLDAVEVLIGIDGKENEVLLPTSTVRKIVLGQDYLPSGNGFYCKSNVSIKITRHAFGGRWGYNVREELVERATGDWIAYLDSDDALAPFALKDLQPVLENQHRPIITRMFVFDRTNTWANAAHKLMWIIPGRLDFSMVGTPMLLHPNRQDLHVKYRRPFVYHSDYFYIRDTVTSFARAGLPALWNTTIFCEVNPWAKPLCLDAPPEERFDDPWLV